MQTEYGLTEQELAAIVALMAANPKIERALIFGSRAMGNFREGSDVDLCIFGPELTHKDVRSLRGALDDLVLLLFFDVVVYHRIQNPELQAHIMRVGKAIYERKANPASAA